MKIIKLAILLAGILILTNCGKEDAPSVDPLQEQEEPKNEDPKEPATEVYYTLNTFIPPYEVTPSEDWVIIHDSNGKILDYSSYEAGDKIEFEAPVDSLTPFINVSYLKYTETNGNKTHSINTLTNVEKGIVENFGPYQSVDPVLYIKTGEFDVVVEKIPNPFGVAYPVKVEVSSGLGRLGGGGGGIGYPSGIELTLDRRSKYEGYDDYLISILDGNNALKYYYFDNPNTQNFTLDYTTDFKEFETDISVLLPEHNSFNLNIAGFKEGQEFNQYGGYWLHDVISVINSDVDTQPLRLGYIDIFSKYRTQFNINMTDFSYSIVKYGDAIQELNIPEKPQLVIMDSSLKTFNFNVDIDFIKANHSWAYDEGSYANNDFTRTGWGLTADKGSLATLGELPTEILEKYPTMNVEALSYVSSRFHLPLSNAEFNSSHTVTVYNN